LLEHNSSNSKTKITKELLQIQARNCS